MTTVEEAAQRKASNRRAVVVGISALSILVVGVGGCALFVAHGLASMQFGRRPLSPISVSSDACPELRPVHDLAAKLNDQWTRALDGRETWPLFQADLAAELPWLEGAITNAETYVPARIANKFEIVVLDLRLGLAELPHASSAFDVLALQGSGKSPVVDGDYALADASDLVGNVCGYRLAPSNPLTP